MDSNFAVAHALKLDTPGVCAHWRKRATLKDELRRARWKLGFDGTAIGPESSCAACLCSDILRCHCRALNVCNINVMACRHASTWSHLVLIVKHITSVKAQHELCAAKRRTMMLSTELYDPSDRVDASRDALRVVGVSSDGFRELTRSSEGLRELTRSSEGLREWPPLTRSSDALREPPLPACPPPRVARPCRPPGICAAARRATLSLSASFRAAAVVTRSGMSGWLI